MTIAEMRNIGRSGFSLLEIMIVVSIIGLLAAVAMPSIIKARTKARRTIATEDLRVLAGAVDQLAMQTGKWPGGIIAGQPASPEVWNLTLAAAGIISSDGRFPRWQGPYIKTLPEDPWGENYFFDPDYLINGKMYAVIGSFGPNKGTRNGYDTDDIYVIVE